MNPEIFMDAGFDISFEDVGVARVTGFCPMCQAQVFGSLADLAVEDMVAHLNLFHDTSVRGRA